MLLRYLKKIFYNSVAELRFKQNETVTFVGNKAERLGIKGAKVNASSTKTKISHVDVEEL